MLDLNHPQTKHIFAASNLEDAVLGAARQIVAARPSERQHILDTSEETFNRMRKLNSEHFANSSSIAKAIDELCEAFRTFAAHTEPRLEMLLPALENLRSDAGFGTVWI
jgi:hypothetical protein